MARTDIKPGASFESQPRPAAKRTISFIGGGHITEIILENLVPGGAVANFRLIVSDPLAERTDHLAARFGTETVRNNARAAQLADIVFINVPPLLVNAVIADFAQIDFSGKLLITLAAGVEMARYQAISPEIAVVRALPNPPSQIGQGVIALSFNPAVQPAQKKEALDLFSSMGVCVSLAEGLINVVTSLSSPASIYLFFQSLIDAGVLCGLNRETATTVASQTIFGCLEVWKRRGVPPTDLLSQAATPGGISVETILTLENFAFRAAIQEAIRSGVRKAESFGSTGQVQKGKKTRAPRKPGPRVK